MSLSLWVSRSETICDNQVVHFSATAPTHSGPLTASKKWYVGCADVEQPEEITTSCFKAKSWTAFNSWRGLLPPVYKAKSWTAIQKIVSATQNHASFLEADRAHNRILRQDMSDHLSLLEQPPPLLPTLPLLFVPAQVRGQEYAVGWSSTLLLDAKFWSLLAAFPDLLFHDFKPLRKKDFIARRHKSIHQREYCAKA